MINFKFIKSSIFKNFFISYLIVFIIPLSLVFGVLYRINTNIVEKEIYSANNSALNHYRIALDDKIKTIKSLNYVLDNNYNLNSVITVKDNEFTSPNRLAAWRFIEQIYPYTIANPFVEYLYIYSHNSNYIITDNNTNKRKSFFEDIHQAYNEDISFEDWELLMSKRHRGSLVAIPQKKDGEKVNKNYIYYLQSLPMVPTNTFDATVAIKFDFADELEKSEDANQKMIMLIDKDNNILYSNNDNIPLDFSYEDFKEKQGHFTLEGKFVNYVKTQEFIGAFISITKEDIIFKDLHNIQFMSWLILLGCLILGGILTYYFTVHNYNPVKKLLMITRQYANIQNKDINSVSNLTEISLALMEAIDEKVTYENYYIENKRLSLEGQLIDLLSDKNQNVQLLTSITRKMGCDFTHKYFCMIKVTLTDFSQVFFDPSKKESKDVILQPLQAYRKLYEEMLRDYDQHLMILKDNMLIIVINFINKTDETVNYLSQIINKTQIFMRDNYAIDSFTAISNFHMGVAQLFTAYKEIVEVSEYFNLVGIGDMLFYNEMTKSSLIQSLEKTNIAEERLLIGNIKNGNFQKAKEVLDNIFKKYFFDDIKSPQIIKFRMFSLVNSIIDAILSLEIPNINKFIEELHPFSRILESRNARALHDELIILLEEINKFFKKEENNLYLELKKRIVTIVDENYTNPDINVSFIAQATGKSLDYISRYFKKTTRIGLLDYIHHKRINEAKRILKNEDISINKIANIVGYTNTDSFIRVFKKIEGITPGQFRKQPLN